jgi:hypothetical protein
MPNTSSKDLASIAALELSNALQNPAPAAPFSHIGTAQLQALLLIPQVRLAHKYLISPWEMIRPPGGDNPVHI